MHKFSSFTPTQRHVLQHKGTEAPFSGCFLKPGTEGTYLCRGCGQALFRGNSQFLSQCGWPSFDDAVSGAVAEVADADGRRVEIVCQRCRSHLGHVFRGEGYTHLNTRHCVNSVSIDFVESMTVEDTDEIIVAGGCFWGVEYYLQQHPAVLLTEVGYTGGAVEYPSYHAVCRGDSGHYEAVRVVFDNAMSSCGDLVKLFFEIHDPFQADGQGNDRGSQYLSAIFVYDQEQHQTAVDLKTVLEEKYSCPVATKVLPVQAFWPAEPDHQSYYQKNGQQPYCHAYTSRFK